jgi:polysaccharide export outer membrane protein
MEKKSRRNHLPVLPFYKLLLLCVALGLVTGCAGGGPKPTAKLEDIMAQESSTQQEVKQLNDQLFASVASAPQVQDYLISQGDLLQVTVFEDKTLGGEARVSARGVVTLPLVGALEVAGLTTQEAEQKIEDAYKVKYLHDPHVSIFVKEQMGSKITLLGAMTKPGTHDYMSRQRLLDVLALGGGLSDKAGRIVQVRRPGNDPAHPTTLLIDIDELVKAGNLELNIEIKGGDVIYVPDAGTVYVDGAVRKPGTYPIKQATTVQEAIVAAGGFTSTADEGEIKLVRSMGNGKREVVQMGLEDIRRDATNNLQIKDRDIIFVETNTSKALLYGLKLNFGYGLVGFGYTPPGTATPTY